MRKRNHTVTIRMNNEEYNLLQNKVKESGRTQQEVVIKAIADLNVHARWSGSGGRLHQGVRGADYCRLRAWLVFGAGQGRDVDRKSVV